MGAMQRRKGARGECELIALLREHLGEELTRNLDQARDGGADLKGGMLLAGYAIECKRAAKAEVRSWWQQAFEQAYDVADGRVPVLAYRIDRSREKWRFVLPISEFVGGDWRSWPGLEYTATMGIWAFAAVVRDSDEVRRKRKPPRRMRSAQPEQATTGYGGRG